jgi:DNA-binding NarL/FixJ family response regulator
MRVVIAEDSVLLRAGIVRLLHEINADVVAEVGDGETLVAAADRFLPDLVITDVRMPPNHSDEGVRAALEIRRRQPAIAILVLSQYVEEHYATELLAGETAGIGYLLKDRVADVSDFIAAVLNVASGGTTLDPEVVSQLLARSRRRDPLATLTPREMDVLRLISEGRSNTAIAGLLVVSEGAVEKHVSNIFTKLDLPQSTTDHRRVLAVLRYLEGAS